MHHRAADCWNYERDK